MFTGSTYIDLVYTLMHKVVWVHVPDDHKWMLPIFALVLFVAPIGLVVAIFQLVSGFIWRLSDALSNSSSERQLGIIQDLERFAVKNTISLQVRLVAVSLITIPLGYLALLLPKHIVNGVLVDKFVSAKVLGFNLSAVEYLLLLCASYLAVISVSNYVKYIAKIIGGRINERIVRRIRLAVVRRGRRTNGHASRSTLSAIAIQECEPIGYFGGSLVVVPLIQGGTLLTSLVFLFIQDIALAMAALVMLPVQIALLPRIQRRINAKIRDRVYSTRDLNSSLMIERGANSERPAIGEFSQKVRSLEQIRCEIWDLKARFKTVYNYTSNLTPFFFFTIGGYLVLQGRLSLGALVAALAAYREIAPALRELFDFVQAWSDARARFAELSHALGWGTRLESIPQAASGRALTVTTEASSP